MVAAERVPDGDRLRPVEPATEFTDMGWPVRPEGIVPLLERLRDRGFETIYITENGAACADLAGVDGFVDDHDRIAYLERHFAAVASTIEDGVGVRGYFVWSLLDNFEWAYGYDKRFGLVRVDYESLTRTPKASAHWFRQFTGAAPRA